MSNATMLWRTRIMAVALPVALTVALAQAIGAGVVPEAQAQRLGRLLTTSEERAALDALRRQAGMAQPVVEPVPEPEAPAPVQAAGPAGPTISSLKINGVVRRSGGPSSIWVNGDLLERGGTSREGVSVESGRGLAGSVRLRLPSGAGTVALRPGQQIDIDTGALLEAYEKRSEQPKGSAFVPQDRSAATAPVTPEAAPDLAPEATPGAMAPDGGPDPGPSSEAPADAMNKALGSLADPDTARSAEERAAIESLRGRVEQSLAGRPAAKKP